LVRVGVIGTGGWGKNHLRVLAELNALAAFCDIDKAKVDLYRAKYRVPGYTSLEELFQEGLDAVTVCTPTTTHHEVARKALEWGLDVFVEKPLAASPREGEELVALAEGQGLLLGVGYIERFNPAVQELKRLFRERRIGDPLLLEFHRENRWVGVVTDIGVVLDTAVHDIDTALWLFEEAPQVVYARTGRVMSNHEDFAAILLGFEGERTAFLTANWVTPKRVRQLVAVCSKGVATIDFVSQRLVIDESEQTVIPRLPWQEPLKAELEAFLKLVEGRDKDTPLALGPEALRVSQIAEAALISGRTGSPIFLNLDR
jgi:UDP-N-acetylglucosamine 3-dehydrogenase